jgi:hypothetical protein
LEREANPPAAREKAPASGASKLKITSNFEATVWIDDRKVGRTGSEWNVKSGWRRIEIEGTIQGLRFNRSQLILIEPGESKEVPLNIRRVRVQVQGLPPETKVLSMDSDPIEKGNWADTYEGWHTLALEHVPTGKISSAECQAKVGEKACTVVMTKLHKR